MKSIQPLDAGFSWGHLLKMEEMAGVNYHFQHLTEVEIRIQCYWLTLKTFLWSKSIGLGYKNELMGWRNAQWLRALVLLRRAQVWFLAPT